MSGFAASCCAGSRICDPLRLRSVPLVRERGGRSEIPLRYNPLPLSRPSAVSVSERNAESSEKSCREAARLRTRSVNKKAPEGAFSQLLRSPPRALVEPGDLVAVTATLGPPRRRLSAAARAASVLSLGPQPGLGLACS